MLRYLAIAFVGTAWLLLAVGALAADLPDPRLTPGATFRITAAQLCAPGYAKSVRMCPTI